MNYAPLNPIFPVPTKETDYFFTQTLSPMLYRLKKSAQIKRTIKELQRILPEFCTRYAIVAEITRKGNVHYHGYFTPMQGVGEMHIEVLRDIMSNVIGYADEITQIKNNEDVYKYMCKSLDKTNVTINYRVKSGQLIKKTDKPIMWYWQKDNNIFDIKVKGGKCHPSPELDTIRQCYKVVEEFEDNEPIEEILNAFSFARQNI